MAAGGETMPITLRAARINANYTQVEAARLIGVTTDTLSNWERGLSFPNVMHLQKIIEHYKVQYDELIFLPNNNA